MKKNVMILTVMIIMLASISITSAVEYKNLNPLASLSFEGMVANNLIISPNKKTAYISTERFVFAVDIAHLPKMHIIGKSEKTTTEICGLGLDQKRGYLFSLTEFNLNVYDLKKGMSIITSKEIYGGAMRGLYVKNKTLYVCYRYKGVLAYDISKINSISLIKQIDVGDCWSVYQSGLFVYVGLDRFLKVYQRNKNEFKLLNSVDFGRQIRAVIPFKGNKLVVLTDTEMWVVSRTPDLDIINSFYIFSETIRFDRSAGNVYMAYLYGLTVADVYGDVVSYESPNISVLDVKIKKEWILMATNLGLSIMPKEKIKNRR